MGERPLAFNGEVVRVVCVRCSVMAFRERSESEDCDKPNLEGGIGICVTRTDMLRNSKSNLLLGWH